MAENNAEINVINHLLSVEKDASVLIDNAVKEADEKTSKARNQANLQFQQKYDSCVAEMETEYQEKLQYIKDENSKEIEKFKTDLENKTLNTAAFKDLLDKLLFA